MLGNGHFHPQDNSPRTIHPLNNSPSQLRQFPLLYRSKPNLKITYIHTCMHTCIHIYIVLYCIFVLLEENIAVRTQQMEQVILTKVIHAYTHAHMTRIYAYNIYMHTYIHILMHTYTLI